MESIEQTNSSSHSKRKLGNNEDNHEHFYAFDIEHEQSTKSFCCRSPSSNSINNTNSLTNYQQTTKIIQEFNIQQSTTSDITVSSTINIKSTPKSQIKISNNNTNEFLSEADFQRVVQDITPADRDLFDEFLNGIKQKTDDYLFLSSFDELPSSSSSSTTTTTTVSNEYDSISRRHSSVSLPTQTSSIISTDKRRYSIPRGSSTIHYSPHTMPITNRPPPPPPPTAAAQTLKQMAVQHQQRALYNQQQQQQMTSSSNYPYNNSTRQYYQQTENETIIDPTSYYQPMSYPSVQQTNMSAYNHHSQQQRSNIYGIQNYSYQTSSSTSFYQQQQQQQQLSASSYPMNNYSPSNGLPLTNTTTTTTTLPSAAFYSQEDNLPILDL